MHFHAEHALFFERRQTLGRAVWGLGLTLCILIVNAGVNNATLSLIGSGIGLLFLIGAYVHGQRRVESALTWTLALIVCVILGGVALNRDLSLFIDIAARISCGVIWVLWLGTQMDWSSLRQLLLAIRIPETIVSTLDHALMHGILTQREWICRRNAARLRLGASRLPLSSWAQLLGEGALHAFLRLERVEENALIRSSPISDREVDDTIRLDAVSVTRGEQVVLKQLNFRVTTGEWVLVCGPSGAGKSSLLRLLAGLDGPAQGVMTRLGSSVSPGAELRDRLDGRIALLVQNPEHHFIASTVAEDIIWGLLRRNVDVAEAQTRSFEMAKALGVDHVWDRPCHDLSFGEQRRVALAGLLVLEPRLLLLDEPTAGLDPVAAHELRLVVQQLVKRTGASCIWATHDLNSRPTQAHRIVLLRDQRLLFDGPVTEGLSRPWMLQAGLAVPQEGAQLC